ncbi:50S ribosomal protein L23 [Buchnera aphidicola (Hormaphis cornu)]|nr:50S ribosomal protein L23 [Buchnera aphidicola (Hormaphis cornu)]
MISEDRLFKILVAPYISEKSSINIEKYNTFVLKVLKDATKFEIKMAIYKIFEVKVKKINTLIVKGKKKRLNNGRYSYRSDWKKAYVTLYKGQNLDLIGMQK